MSMELKVVYKHFEKYNDFLIDWIKYSIFM